MANQHEVYGPYAPGMFERSLDQRPSHRPLAETTPTPQRVVVDAPYLARSAFAGVYDRTSSEPDAAEQMRRALQASMDLHQ